MSEPQDANDAVIQKTSGITPSEQYLAELCERNFLSLWSYPRPFRDQGGGKELCDLLVVMGNDVIIFSDKHCTLEPRQTLDVDWSRWFRAAVKGGAKQAWGAERWLREQPHRVFLDPGCSRPLPVPLPDPGVARYHLVVTVHGVSAACRSMLGGTGSLMLRTDVRGLAAHDEPFVIGDLDPTRSFVHVLDDTTLDLVLTALDTTADFVAYLREKEEACRSRVLAIAGEENLLANYLTTIGEGGRHILEFDRSADVVILDESHWDAFEKSRERRSQLLEDEISYAWDGLIESFASHALAGTAYLPSEPAFESAERILRHMAAEPRFRRRMLADALLEAMRTTPPGQRRIRVIPSQLPHEPMYIFLIFPWREDQPVESNRLARRQFLQATVQVARMLHRNAADVVGLATEAGMDRDFRTEDAVYLDGRVWDAENDRQARDLQKQLQILVRPTRSNRRFSEYPAGDPTPRRRQLPKNPRNRPCPCESGRKYKHCHGA